MMGLMLSFFLTVAFLITACTPETDMGKALRRMLVDSPARLLNGGPLKIFVALAVLAGLLVFAVGAPEMVALLGMTDLSLYLDMAILSLVLSAAEGLMTASRRIAEVTTRLVAPLGFAPRRSKRSGVRTRRSRKPQHSGSNDDASPSDHWAIAA